MGRLRPAFRHCLLWRARDGSNDTHACLRERLHQASCPPCPDSARVAFYGCLCMAPPRLSLGFQLKESDSVQHAASVLDTTGALGPHGHVHKRVARCFLMNVDMWFAFWNVLEPELGQLTQRQCQLGSSWKQLDSARIGKTRTHARKRGQRIQYEKNRS